MDFFETFAPTPTISSTKVILAIAVQQGLQYWNVRQAFVDAELDVEVYMVLLDGCGEMSGKVMKLERAFYGVKQDRQKWSALLCKTLVDTCGVEQCRADPCVFRKMENKENLIMVMHIDDLLVSAKTRQCKKSCSVPLMASSPPKSSGSWSRIWGVL